MYLSNRKPDCRPYTPGLPNLHQPEDPDMAGWHITTPAAAWNNGRLEENCWLHSANWIICVTKRTRRRRRRKELCAIRDNITTCDIASITDIIAMIEDICTN